jgi:hypothetical protein
MLTAVVVQALKLALPRSPVVYIPFGVSQAKMMPISDRQQCRSSGSLLNLNDQRRGRLELVLQQLLRKTAIAPTATGQGHVLLIR